jgi:hypothetical protein
MYTKKFCLILAAAALVGSARGEAGEFSSLEERMSQSEFHAAGLDKLTPAELHALDDWLRAHYVTTPTYVTPSGKPVFYPQESAREVVESRIDGTFTGWYGHEVFRLENGQEWTQAESGTYQTAKYDHPRVRIKPMLLGSWLMYVEPCGCSVRVERTR